MDDLEADILSSMKELGGETPTPAPEPVAAPVVEDAGVEAAEPVKEPAVKVDADGRVRGPDGKFAPKTRDEAAEPVEATAAPAEAKQGGPILPPAEWPPEAKAAFMEAPEHVQKAILKRQEELDTGHKEVATKTQSLDRINKVIEPMVGKWAMQGLSPDAAIGQLVSAANLLQQNPRDGFEHLLRTYAGDKMLHVINDIASKYGYALAEADQTDQPTQGHEPAYADPEVSRLRSELAELTQWKQTQERQRESEAAKHLSSEVEAVRKDPKNIYFENVKQVVAALATQAVQNGDTRPTKEIVQDCYDRAVWADPTIRGLQLQAQQKASEEAARKAAAAKAAAARQAAGSITGSPGPGAAMSRPNGSSHSSIEDDVRAAIASRA